MLCIFWGVLTEEQKNLVEHIFHTHHILLYCKTKNV